MLAKLLKLAYTLDQKREFALANEVDKVVAELAKRTGLTAQDIAAVANELDDLGETETATKLDTLLAAKVNKKFRGKRD